MINDAQSAISYLNSVDWHGSRLGLDRVRELLARLENPEKSLRIVHTAGTNGKGSTCAMTAGGLTAAGHKTGLFVSPYVMCFAERIQIGGAYIPDGALVSLTREVASVADAMPDHPTTFEMITALGLLYFQREGCEFAVIECGLGGRLDATNAIDSPEVCLITRIGLDHTEYLGDTLQKIAREKAAIIKRGAKVAVYDQSEDIIAVFREKCPDLVVARGECDTALIGAHQRKNAALALRALKFLGVSEDIARRSFMSASVPARFEVLRQNPPIIVDGGHNPQCAEALAATVAARYPGEKFNIIMGVMADKDFQSILTIVKPFCRRLYALQSDSARALPAADLVAAARKAGIGAEICADIGAVFNAPTVALGSFYIAERVIHAARAVTAEIK